MSSTEILTLAAGDIAADIARLGAELVRLRYRGRNLLWSGDPRFWASRSPILFPVIGRVHDGRIRIGATDYPMPQHGFAHGQTFEIIEHSGSSCRLRLTSDQTTLAQFPFPFVLDLIYTATDSTLTIEAIVGNPAAQALPASLGFHPGFLWPLEPGLSKSDYCVSFPDDEVLTANRMRDGRFTEETYEVRLVDGSLFLDDGLFEHGAMVFRSLKSRSVRFQSPKGGAAIAVAYEGLPQLALWMKPGGGFLCIEPWHGFSDPIDFAGAFFDKPGIATVLPQGNVRFSLKISPDFSRVAATV